MMHYGFCRKHADQMGEGGCPECAMDHQQAEILELRDKLQAAEIALAADDQASHIIEWKSRAEAAESERNAAIFMLAEWCVCVELNGSGWDDWDECYKDAAYRPGPLRELLDTEIAKQKASPEWGR